MLQGMVRIEVQVLISVYCLSVNRDFDGTVRFACGKIVQKCCPLGFAGELDVRVQTVDTRGEIINSVTVDLHKCIVDITKPYRRSNWGGCNIANCSKCSISSL